MPDALLLAQLNAVTGREGEFGTWYTNVHLRDVLRMDGSIAAQRFERVTVRVEGIRHSRFGYLTVYDVTDPEAVSAGHADAAGTAQLVMSGAADLSDVAVHYYYPHLTILGDGDLASAGAAVLAEFEDASPQGVRSTVQAAWDLTRALTRAELVRGVVATYRAEAQMFRRPPSAKAVVLLMSRTDPLEVIATLARCGLPSTPPTRLTVYSPASARITKESVLLSGATDIEIRTRALAAAGPPTDWGGPRGARHRGA